jgi:hypothetical protein
VTLTTTRPPTVQVHGRGITLRRDPVPDAGGYLWQMGFGSRRLDLFTLEPVCEVCAWFHQLPNPPFDLRVEVTVFPDDHPAVNEWLRYQNTKDRALIADGLGDVSRDLRRQAR